MKIIKFEDLELHIDDSNTLSTNEVALGYGVSASTIRDHKKQHSDELLKNIHYIEVWDEKFKRYITRWTLEGVHMLGFFIKSERAKEFRKFTAKLLTEIKKGNVQVSLTPPQNCPAADNMSTRIAGYKGQLALRKKEIEALRWELIQANEKLKEYERELNVVQPLRAAVLKEHQKKIETQKQYTIMLEHNFLDLAGSYARLKAELAGRAETLEFVAKELKSRVATIDHFIDTIGKILPKAKDVADSAGKQHTKDVEFYNMMIKRS